MKFNKGDKIPEFKLRDHNEEEVSLDEFEGNNILLSFHPLAWTSVCRNQMQALEDNFDKLERNNTVPLGISVDPVPSKSAWAEDMELKNLRLVSDFWPHGEFATKLGIFIKEKGISGRVNILVNSEGEVLWAKEYDIPELPDIDEVLEVVANNA
ncbi:MAG: alkyl hydroperoxide reductase [Halanaerobium sp. 4-GBenrich]|jgi:peroxiredoxin|uniref:Peroxiredoxin n=1 Tax=Halanaerobium congolense TaxID=54121 RepID=A0A4R7E0B6_9FIRM|nr:MULTISPECIES: redoxin domain-containing protein [Halanaerobium]ODS50480.1 MAG: alkyl hydroperoxide reductase [Halanaerobium sp. 4-GBenrich]PUU87966.1 MAG: alkyl hydroperoxide reductase [Halanaerobium sp.]TDS27737.1 peroxiredoxin [Halanaerobium congolense]